MVNIHLEALLHSTEQAISALSDDRIADCDNRAKTGKSCAGRYMGSTVFWYGADCTLPAKKFCAPCLALWTIQVFRNILFDLRRRD